MQDQPNMSPSFSLFFVIFVYTYAMTVEQKANHILTLAAELPIFQRLRVALTILRGVDPEYITPTDSGERMPWETKEFLAELDRRSEELRSGKVKPIQGDEFMAELRAMREK